MGTTRLVTLIGWALAGLVAGWLVRPVALALDLGAPRVPWLSATAFYVVALVLAVLARATHRALQQDPTPRHHRGRLTPQEAVNRLVLAKACALVGALLTGGYAGYALTWVGVGAELAGERIALSLTAALGSLLTVLTSLALERACRVRDDPESP